MRALEDMNERVLSVDDEGTRSRESGNPLVA
jgi:hypothetical protein